jgi:hydroxymethylpyrimidine pyrophosphatase-like HAD family hydrolase
MYRLITLDVDGTLLNPQGQVTPRVKEAIRAATRKGCIVTLATGRRLRPARRIAQEVGIEVPLILYSGNLIYDTAQEKPLLHRTLNPAFVKTALEFLSEIRLSVALLQSPLHGERIFIGPGEDTDPYLQVYAARPDREDLIVRCTPRQLLEVPDPLVVCGVGPGHREETLLTHLKEWGHFESNLYSYSLRTSPLTDLHGFDFLPPDHNKGYALVWLAHHYGVELAETLAIGDNRNDLDMLQTAGLGVAMQNAAAIVKARADVITASNAEDGVAEALERYVL